MALSSIPGWVAPRTRRGLARMAVSAVGLLVFFGVFCRPIRIVGISMDPTYRNGSLNFCRRYRASADRPQLGDVVVLRYAGSRAALLKRVIGRAGDQIEFVAGRLLRNGQPVAEPYVIHGCDWTVPPRIVKPGHLYVMGDNRSMPFEQHEGGQISQERVLGAPLW